MSTSKQYIKLDKNRNTYKFQRHIPEDVRKYFDGKPTLTRSLKTDSLSEAVIQRNRLVVEMDEKIRLIHNGQADLAAAIELKGQKANLTAEEFNARSADIMLDQFQSEDEFNDPSLIPEERRVKLKTLESVIDGKAALIDEYVNKWLDSLDLSNSRIVLHKRALKLLAKHFPDISTITRKQASTFIDDVIKPNRKSKTANDYIGSFSKFTEWLINKGYLPQEHHNPWTKQRIATKDAADMPSMPDDVLAEMLEVSKEASPAYHNALLVAALTGMRSAEILRAYEAGITTEDGYEILHVKKGKTKTSIRTVVVKAGLIDWDLVVGTSGKMSTAGRKLLDGIGAESDITPMNSLRHRTATILEHANVNGYTINRWTGHTHESEAFKTYSEGASNDQLKELADLLYEKLPEY